MVFLWVQNKNDPKITKPALQCKPLAPAGPMLAHALTQHPTAAAYMQHGQIYFALTVKKPLDKSTHDIM